jgi:hypothetical protein
MPLTNSNTESSNPRPRTRLGCSDLASISGAGDTGFIRSSTLLALHYDAPTSSHGQFIRGFERRSATAADYGRAVAARQRVGDFGGANRAVENHCGFRLVTRSVRRRFWSRLHEQGL